MTALVRVSGLSGYSSLIQSLGGDPQQLSQDCGIDLQVTRFEDALVPYRQIIHLMEHSATQLKVADLGLRLAAVQDVGILGPLAVAIQNAPTVERAIRCAADFIFIQSSALRLDFDKQGNQTRLAIRIQLNNMTHAGMRQVEDLAIGLIHQVLYMAAGDDYTLLKVELPHEPLCPPAVYEQYFGAPVAFSKSDNAIFIDSKTLDIQMFERSAQLYQAAIDYLNVQQPAPDGRVAERVATAVRRTLGTDSCNRKDIAQAMGLHPRTLHRRLAREGVTFDQIRDGVCREKVEYYLCNTSAPLAQVAAILGYAEQAVLSRNCRRWFGQPPREFRNAHSD
ncbi:HTH-type transcriptional regulator VirS [Halioglobus japonicus]|nr:HTH-type transcriptional regulator VirS [Halioglobus japonicus]